MAVRVSSLFRTLALLSALSLTVPAFAEDGPGTLAVRHANESVATLLKQKPEPGSPAEKKLASEISSQLKTFLDIEKLGQRALGEHYKGLSAAQKKEYLSLLRELVEGNYIKAMRSNSTYDVRYLKEEEKDGSRLVSTELEVQRNGRPETMAVDYVLQKEGDSWRAFDLITDGVGLVENYRAQFNKIIAKEGVNGLLDRMRKKKTQNAS
jgi:phospholipid transport system substrate-binding protein